MFKKLLSLIVIFCFFLTTLGPVPQAHADTVLGLPAPGTMVNLSPAYEPVMIKGLTVHKDNPFLFDFIVDVGQDRISGEPLKKEGEKLIKYFLASLAIPDKDVWVNLSPYEKNRMIPEALGQTDMGRDLLEQDYILKQITASLIYPEKSLGKKFWDTVYSKAQQMYGTTQIPVNTFNKVWIMADRAEVFEHNQTAFVVDSHLKVMLEEDYIALTKHQSQPGDMTLVVSPSRLPSETALNMKAPQGNNPTHSITSQIVKQIILPELEKEVNTGKNFANLRQIFNSIILSSWYKRNLKEALLNQVYANQSKVKGINLNDPTVKEQIYQQYLKAYKKGVFNYIKEDVVSSPDASVGDLDHTTIPRKYFSGGINEAMAATPLVGRNVSKLQNMIGSSVALVLLTTGLVLGNPTNSFANSITLSQESLVSNASVGNAKNKTAEAEHAIKMDKVGKWTFIIGFTVGAVALYQSKNSVNDEPYDAAMAANTLKYKDALQNQIEVTYYEFKRWSDIKPEQYVQESNSGKNMPKVLPMAHAEEFERAGDGVTVVVTKSTLGIIRAVQVYPGAGAYIDKLEAAYKNALKEFASLGPESYGSADVLARAQQEYIILLKKSGMPTAQIKEKAYGIIDATAGLSVAYNELEKEDVDHLLSNAAMTAEQVDSIIQDLHLLGYSELPDNFNKNFEDVLEGRLGLKEAIENIGRDDKDIVYILIAARLAWENRVTLEGMASFINGISVFLKQGANLNSSSLMELIGIKTTEGNIEENKINSIGLIAKNYLTDIGSYRGDIGRIRLGQSFPDHAMTAKQERLFNGIREILVDKGFIDRNEKISLDSNFPRDLGMDSLEVIEFEMQLEEKFHVDIPAKITDTFITIRDVVDFLEEHTNAAMIAEINELVVPNQIVDGHWAELPSGSLFLGPHNQLGTTTGDTPRDITNIWAQESPQMQAVIQQAQHPDEYLSSLSFDRLDDKIRQLFEKNKEIWLYKTMNEEPFKPWSYLQKTVQLITYFPADNILRVFPNSQDNQLWLSLLTEMIRRSEQQRFVKTDAAMTASPTKADVDFFVGRLENIPSEPIYNGKGQLVIPLVEIGDNNQEVLVSFIDEMDPIIDMNIETNIPGTDIVEGLINPSGSLIQTMVSWLNNKRKNLPDAKMTGPELFANIKTRVDSIERESREGTHDSRHFFDAKTRLLGQLPRLRLVHGVNQEEIEALEKRIHNLLYQISSGEINPSSNEDVKGEQTVNQAQISNVTKPWVQGGIDLNTSNGMQWKVSKDGNGVEMTIDPGLIERIRHIGIDSLSPVIFRMTPVASIWPLVGLQAPAQ